MQIQREYHSEFMGDGKLYHFVTSPFIEHGYYSLDKAEAEDEFTKILKSKIEYYGETKAAYQFAAEEYAEAYHQDKLKNSVIPEELEEEVELIVTDNGTCGKEKRDRILALFDVSNILQWCYNYIKKYKDSDERTAILQELKNKGCL